MRFNEWELSKGLRLRPTSHGLYAYNSILGNFRRLSKQEERCLGSLSEDSVGQRAWDPAIMDKLLQDAFIKRQRGPDEYQLIEPLKRNFLDQTANGKSITKLLLILTNYCMLHCQYCYLKEAPGVQSAWRNRDKSGESFETTQRIDPTSMSWQTAKKSIDGFHSMVKEHQQKVVHIRFYGGEPLMCWDLIKKSVERIESNFGMIKPIFHINTNGVLLTDAIAKFLVAHDVDIEVSVDGKEDVHNKNRLFKNGGGSFHHAITAIRRLIASGIHRDHLCLACTLNLHNAAHLRELVDLVGELGLNKLDMNVFHFRHPLDLLDRVDERTDVLVDARIYGAEKGVEVNGKWFKLFSRLKDPVMNYCGRFGKQIGVDAAGNIVGCAANIKPLGHIDYLDKLFSDPRYMHATHRVIGEIEDCAGCDIEGMCAGGCMATALKDHGDFYRADSKECEFRRRIVKKMIEKAPELTGTAVSIEEVDQSYDAVFNNYRENK